ncbi:hypothetical protein LWF01_03810 [Saxibacter everestensis]|uniref:Uncharacterized protein n=1 Tax=Saxibacter everestensis TaxID=2909229 RepID=A0ABY8QV88_9MICO|nr:hypothetical protein LWF01_03810 [Brevibacteriaceae bacterium ZFBP1038]
MSEATLNETEVAALSRIRTLLDGQVDGTVAESLKRLPDKELGLLPLAVVGLVDLSSRFITVAAAATGRVRAAVEFLARLEAYSNIPNLLKGIPKVPAEAALTQAALTVVDDEITTEQFNGQAFGFPTSEFWGIAALAARADADVIERLRGRLVGEWVPKHLSAAEKATVRHTELVQADRSAGANPAPEAPQKVSEVKSWLANHPEPDVASLAPNADQRAAARVAAVRALTKIGTRQAFEVLKKYGTPSHSDAMLKELHVAWARFDRREFAAAMFQPRSGWLDLGESANLEGVDAIPGLTHLTVLLGKKVDLSPLAGCNGLERLVLHAFAAPGIQDITPLAELPALTELHLIGFTSGADLATLSRMPVRRLRIDLGCEAGDVLLSMPQLERLLVAGEADGEPAHPGLGQVVRQLARTGVQVVVYRHEESWVPQLVKDTEACSGLHCVSKSGYVALTTDESGLEKLTSRLFNNIVP